MDCEQLITHARARFDHAAAKKILREKYQAKLVFAYRGGMFRCSPELMVFLEINRGQHVILPDLFENPLEVDADELLELVRQRWQEQMNAWLIEHNELSRRR